MTRSTGAQAAARRWRRHNMATRLDGCKCGATATYVRYVYGTIGGVPAELWTCETHVDVNHWAQRGPNEQGKYTWVPAGDYDEAALRWVSAPRRAPEWKAEDLSILAEKEEPTAAQAPLLEPSEELDRFINDFLFVAAVLLSTLAIVLVVVLVLILVT